MITKFKIYEAKIINVPEIGDYVIMKRVEGWGEEFDELINFLSTQVGKVIDYTYDDDDNIRGVQVQYYNIPKELKIKFPKSQTKSAKLQFIEAYGKTPEEVKIKISANKFNL